MVFSVRFNSESCSQCFAVQYLSICSTSCWPCSHVLLPRMDLSDIIKCKWSIFGGNLSVYRTVFSVMCNYKNCCQFFALQYKANCIIYRSCFEVLMHRMELNDHFCITVFVPLTCGWIDLRPFYCCMWRCRYANNDLIILFYWFGTCFVRC